jgi:polyisoprenoid-binding protein YceI
MKTQLAVLITVTAMASAVAAPQTFDFKDPKGVNNAVFKMDAPLEAITGSANGISGTVTFDPDKPAETKGRIVVATESLTVPNNTMKGHMHGERWMNVAKFPEITFEVKEVRNAKREGDAITGDAFGTFTMKDVSKEMSVPVKLTFLPDKLGARVQGKKGDLLVVRASFNLKRTEFGLMPGQMEDRVANDIELTLSIAGAIEK